VDGSGHGIEDRAGRRTWLPATALVGITLIFYHGLWLPDLVLIKRDAFRYHLPIKQYLVEHLSTGELPQWFPYEALGRPFIGVAHTALFHPFTALYFFLPVTDAYRASTLLSCLLAAVGAFALGRTLNFSRTGALIAGVSFTLSGYVVSMTDNIVYLYSICALPLFCATLEKAFLGSRALTVAPAVVWASVLLNGDMQMGYYYGFIALLWAGGRAPGSYGEAGLRLGLTGGLAALLAGIQLGPSWAVFTSSDRVHPAEFLEQALQWSTHPLRLPTMLASLTSGHADPTAVAHFFFDIPLGGYWSESPYLGVPVIGLALLGAWHRRDLRALALLGCLALWLALGRYGGLYELFYHVVPLWSAFRYPEKFMGIVSFAAAMLAGAGMDVLRAGKGHLSPWLIVALFCGSAWLILRTDAASTWTAAHFGAPEALALEVTSTAALAFLFSAVATLGVWMLVLGVRKGWLRKALLLPFLVMIVTLDLARANFVAYHTGPAETATFMPPLAEALRAHAGTLGPGRFRLISMRVFLYAVPLHIRQLLGPEAESIERRHALDLEHNVQFHLEAALGYSPGYSKGFTQLFQQKPRMETAARFNVAYFIGPTARLQNPLIARGLVATLPDYNLVLFQNPVPAKPRAYLSAHPERAGSPVDPAMLLAWPDFLNGDLDVVEAPDEPLPGPALSGSAVIEHYAPENVRVRVETPQPAVLVLLDAFDQGWTATLDGGIELPIMRANALVRAVAVPAGAHVVTFSYQAPLLRAGALASLAGTLICAGLLVHARRRTRPVDTG
jgi:hypothetical protein